MRKYLIYLLVLFGGAILTQSFQCTSMNVSSARNAVKQKNYDKAIQLLDKELEVNPSSEEALDLLFQVYDATNNIDKQVEVLNKLDQVAQSPKIKQLAPAYKTNLWVKCYQNTIKYYNKASESKTFLDSAVYYADKGISLKPQSTLLYPIKGTILETKGDEAAAIETYKEYLEIINPIIDVMKSKKIYLGDNTDKVQSVLGKPKSSVSSLRQGSQDTAIVEIYDIDGKEAYLGFLKKFMESSNSLYSFKYDMPANWSDNEKANTEEFDLSPLTRLAFMYYNKENYDLALEYAQMFQSVQPNNSDINRFIIGTYQKAGKTNEALAKMKQLIQDSPQDYQTRTTYADLLAADGKYDEAIYQYKQALSVKSDFDFALHNLGSAYKNLAAELQKKENDKFDKDPSYTRDYTQVKEVLGQSAEAFEAALKTERFANNIDVLFELVNIFDIQDNKDKLKTYLTKIESLEKTIDDEAALYNYYLSLVKVYSGLKDAAKLEEVQKKLEAME